MRLRAFLSFSVMSLALFAGHATVLAQDPADQAGAHDWFTSLNAAAASGDDATVEAIIAQVEESLDPERFYRLGRFYSGHPGQHVLPEADHARAIEYFRQAIALLQGEPGRDARRLLQRSQYELASALSRTATTPIQLAEAVELLEAAAMSGSDDAAMRLGVGLADGSLGTVDVEGSINWLRRAITAGNSEAPLILAERLAMTGDPARVEEAEQMARVGESMLRRAALQGSTSAAVALANAYLDHPLIPADPEEARTWLEYAADRGDARAMLQLAAHTASGSFGEADPGLAAQFATFAAETGSTDAALLMARSLLRQDPSAIRVQPSQALLWLDRALAVGEPRAHALAARLAMERGDVDAYLEELETASTLGDTSASVELISWRIDNGDMAGAEALMASLEGRIALNRVSAVALAEIKLGGGPNSPMYDPEGAVRLLRAAGDQGDGAALYRLAMLNREGRLVERNLQQAAALLEESAERGYFRAMIGLVETCMEGIGVEPSEETAMQWLGRARILAGQRTSNEMLALGRALLDGLIGPDGTTEGLAWLQRAADLGDPRAMVTLGNAYMSGASGTFDPERALSLFRAAVASGDPRANLYLGRAYSTGIGTDMDPQAALAAFTAAAEAGSAEAAAELGLIYSSNGDIPADYRLAYEWLRRSADSGYVPAMIHIANLIAEGALDGIADGTPVSWLTRAAETGDTDAQFQLAVALKRGLLGEPDMAGAEMWMRRAAEAGHFQAQAELQRMTHEPSGS